MADEGDSKEEALRVNDIDASCFDATAFPDPAMLADDMLGRLNMDPLNGLVNGYDTSLPFNEQCGYDKIIGFGGRSWSIRDGNSGEVGGCGRAGVDGRLRTAFGYGRVGGFDEMNGLRGLWSVPPAQFGNAVGVGLAMEGMWFAEATLVCLHVRK
eukprot:364341-Chlamydomonas_euryale.AAC.7